MFKKILQDTPTLWCIKSEFDTSFLREFEGQCLNRGMKGQRPTIRVGLFEYQVMHIPYMLVCF